VEGLDAEQVAERAMKIAAEICVYTNDNFVKEVCLDVGWDYDVCYVSME
jgi:ATP-dependent protease HslVU (ClpYQ) peptidase subunit